MKIVLPLVYLLLSVNLILAKNIDSQNIAPSSRFRKLRLKGSEIISELLNREGVAKTTDMSFANMTEASIKLFKFIVVKNDPRRRIAYTYYLMEKYIKGQVFENALRAYYLSNYPSMRQSYSKYHDIYPITQLVRSLKNIEIGTKIGESEERDGKYRFLFKQTNKITLGKDRLGVTGCPEAVWQYQLFEGQSYLGRIGFNFHEENGIIIVSIVNIQGSGDQKSKLDDFKSLYQDAFSNYLIKKLRNKLLEIIRKKDIEFRGGYYFNEHYKNPNYVLYKMTFRKTKIPICL